jgi:hypothetical protein
LKGQETAYRLRIGDFRVLFKKKPACLASIKSPHEGIQGEKMMNAIRQELHTYIDVIPDRNLYALKPLLSILAEPAFLLETNPAEEEQAIIAEGDREFEEHPENFVPFETINR